VVADVNAAGGEETVRLITQADGTAVFVRTNVARAEEVEALIRTAVATYGRLDYAHNNVGIAGSGELPHNYPNEVWDRVLAVNLTGVWLCMKHEIRQMLGHGGGAIVNTASVAGLRGTYPVGDLAYNSSKHGVVGATKFAALAYAQQGIRINAVCPAFIRTPMTGGDTLEPERAARMAAVQPVGRMGTPEEVAAAVLWLCSDESSFVTGLALPLDGGYTAK
jgi:NAD(P)-dependent dehydrogenase (short-subunit alcohol dehydrogenase family)